MNQMFNYDPHLAQAYTNRRFVEESGVYVCTIEEAKWTTSSNGASALELSVETEIGLKANFLRIYYQSGNLKQNKQITRGIKLINALMGCANVRALSHAPGAKGTVIAPELIGKKVGLVLQKVIKQAAKSDGSDRISLDVIMPFLPDSGKTLLEVAQQSPALVIKKMAAMLKDRIEINSNATENAFAQEQDTQHASRAKFADDDLLI